MIRDIDPVSHQYLYNFAEIGGTLFFRADDGINGYEMWKSDGTEAGTVMVRDINPAGDSYSSSFTEFGGTLFFIADDGTNGIELWKYTPAPTAPTDLGATAISPNQIDLAWTDNSTDEAGFKIFRDDALIHTTAADVITYSDTGLSCDTTHSYEVRGTNADGDSAGATVSGAPSACPVNEAPVITDITTDTTAIDEGGSVFLSGSFTDADTEDTHDVTINWGDGGEETIFAIDAGERSFSDMTHTYADDGSHTITVTVDDGTGAVADPGADTVSSCTLNWGDGSDDSCLDIVMTGGELTHAYTGTGSMEITIDMEDEDDTYTAVAGKTVGVGFPVVAFSSDAYSESESVGSSTVVTLSRTDFTDCVTEVRVSVTAGDATAGTDYDDSGFPVTVTFDADEESRTVSVPVTDDATDEGDETLTLSVTSISNADIGIQESATLTISDDDTRGVTVKPVAGLVTTESGDTATFTVVLDSQPTAEVTISISSDNTGEGTVSPSSLTFSPTGTPLWGDVQTVTVTGVDDSPAADDGGMAYNIVTAAATGGDYAGLDPSDVSATNSDNDTPGITVSPNHLIVDEPSGTASFAIKLNMMPAGEADVTVPLSASEGCTVSDESVIITNTEWETGISVTVTAADDFVDNAGDERICTVSTGDPASDDNNYDSLVSADVADVTVTVQDDDTAGFDISDISGDTTEAGGTATFTVRLTSEPSAKVIISVSSDDTTEGTVSPEVLTFDPDDWGTPKTVTVTGEDDPDEDGDVAYNIVLTGAVSYDTDYHGAYPPGVLVTNTDDPSEYAPGDVNGDGSVDLGDAILCLKILADMADAAEIRLAADVNDDGRIASEELVFILKKLAG